MGTNTVKPPKGFELVVSPPKGFILDEPEQGFMPPRFDAPTIADPQDVPQGFLPETTERISRPQFKTTPRDIRPPFTAPPGTPMEIGPAPEPTDWQKFKGFFVGDRPPLPPNADRMEYVDRAFDIAIGTPLRVFLKFSKGRTLNVPDLMWAGIKRITPESMWDGEVKKMNLDQAMDWASDYDPSGFEKTIGELAEFIGRLKTAGEIGTTIGLLGKTPKDISVLTKALETSKLFGLGAGFEQIAKNLAKQVDPTEAEYGAEGKEAILRDMVLGAILSFAHSGVRGVWTKLKPTEQVKALKLLGLKKGASEREIIKASRRLALKTHPDKVAGLEEKFKQTMAARELLLKGPKRDIVYRAQPPKPPAQITGKVAKFRREVAEALEKVKPAEKAPEPPPKPSAITPPAVAKDVAKPPEVEAVPTVPPTGEEIVPTKPEGEIGVSEKAQKGIDKIRKLDIKQRELEKSADQMLRTSGVGQAPPVFHRELEKVIEIQKQKAKIWNDIRGSIVKPSNKTLWQLAVEKYPIVRFGKETALGIYAKDIDKLLTKPTGEAIEKKAPAEPTVEAAEKATEVKAKVPEGEISRRPVTVEGKKYYPIALPTDQIGIDAAKFQFKLGAKLVGGVTEALKGVEKFDPVKGGQILVWQDKAGKYWVVDGHHRVALAKKTGAETLETWVISEKDGVTEQDARAIGALRNLADGKGTAVDAAKLFRDSDITLEGLRKNAVPTESIVIQQGLDMADLSDEVFRLVVDERLPANMAATIGKQVKNATQQKQVADLILEGEVESLRQAELLAATIDSAPVLTKTEQTLFGLETTEKSLYAERAKVLANVEKKLKLNKKIFGVLATSTGVIEAKGNILAKVENLATKEKAEEVLFMLEKLANTKGPIAEALNDATKQYAENPTKENLSKVTNVLLERWTEGPGRLRIPVREGVPELPLERAKPKVEPKGKPGFIDVRPLEKSLTIFLKTVEPAKITQRAFGKKPGAIVIKGVHQADVGRIEFNEAEIEALDSSLNDFGEKLSRYSNRVLKNLMAARGKPVSKGAVLVKNDALKALAKEAPELIGVRKIITRIADHNYKYLQSVVGDDIHYVEDYYYGIFKDTEKATVENFLDYWHTTDRFTKQKKLPTVADAIAYGLELRDYNPVSNLRSEYMAIARLDGMIYMRDELMRTGKGRYIDTKEEAPHDWEKIKEPVFKDVRVHPELAVMIKSLLSTNKLRRHWALRGLTHTNNALRTLKFMFSMFHQLNILKQSVADEGYLKFLQPSATRGITRGFKKSDPIFRTPAYKDYIRHGGGHRYSIESQAARMVSNAVENLNKHFAKGLKWTLLPIRIPKAYVKWLFQSYIPRVKYSKYLDSINQFEGKNNRTPTSSEKIDIIKEQQNFYGMMNERLFGRSGTVTSLMRLWYMSPGYFEGNFRSILKSILQWGGKEGFRANRSRSNIINSLTLSGIIATITTLIMTGKPPKVPETREDVRDLFKGDTGKKDDKGRKIMIDFLTYDKDYWNILGNVFIGKPDEAAKATIKRGAGMVAPSAQVALDIANMAAGRALVDWKNDRVTEVTDPFARKVLKIAIHEIKRIEPISVSVFKQSRRRDQTRVLSALTSLLGYRPTLTEKDKREQQILHRIYSLKGQQEELYQYLASIRNPRKAVERYNKTVETILSSPMIPQSMRKEWEPKLIIDIERLLENKAYTLGGATQKPKDIERAVKYLKNFGVTENEIEQYIRRKRARETKRAPISPLDRDFVIGLTRRINRAKERMTE